MTELLALQQERMKQEALIRQFENDNEAYNKIRKVAKENVTDTLSDRKEPLRLAIFCAIESIRMDPDKYGPLIYYDDDNMMITMYSQHHANNNITYSSILQQIFLHI
jgi:hypothetical protein